MKTTQHTPLPWTVEGRLIYGDPDCNGNECEIARCGMGDSEKNRADAEFIVRACNAHYALLEALKDLVETNERIGAPPITKGGLCEENDWHHDMRKAKAAIAQAAGLCEMNLTE